MSGHIAPVKKTKEELLQYAIKMRTRGDLYRDILRYLERNCDDQNMIQEILYIVRGMEERERIEIQEEPKSPIITIDILMSLAVIFVGVFLTFALWNRGYIAPLSILVIGTGLVLLFRSLLKR